jgi:hypothetical protein
MSKILGKAEAKPKSLSQPEHADWEFFKEREEEWKVSFRSAYFTVKNGAAPFLYYVNSEFSVLFHYPKENETLGSDGNSLKAILSQSTPGLRKALARDGTFVLVLMVHSRMPDSLIETKKASTLNAQLSKTHPRTRDDSSFIKTWTTRHEKMLRRWKRESRRLSEFFLCVLLFKACD